MTDKKAKTAAKPKNPLMPFVTEIMAIKAYPRFQIIVTHGVLELLVNTLIELKCKNGKEITERQRDYPHSVKVVLLHELGLVDDILFHWLKGFRKLRNEAAHGAEFIFDPKRLVLFKNMSFPKHPYQLTDPHNLGDLCFILVAQFWNSHLGSFGPYFNDNEPKV